jgi:hypothetical protein
MLRTVMLLLKATYRRCWAPALRGTHPQQIKFFGMGFCWCSMQNLGYGSMCTVVCEATGRFLVFTFAIDMTSISVVVCCLSLWAAIGLSGFQMQQNAFNWASFH